MIKGTITTGTIVTGTTEVGVIQDIEIIEIEVVIIDEITLLIEKGGTIATIDRTGQIAKEKVTIEVDPGVIVKDGMT